MPERRQPEPGHFLVMPEAAKQPDPKPAAPIRPPFLKMPTPRQPEPGRLLVMPG